MGQADDSEEESAYNNKRRKGGNKKKYDHKSKKKNNQDDDDENAADEEPAEKKDDEEDQIDTSTTATESKKAAVEIAEDLEPEGPPFFVFYCPKCGVPPEFCQYMVKDLTECKKLLEESRPALFRELYGEPAGEAKSKKKEEKKQSEADGNEEGQITEKKEGDEDGETKVKKEKTKKGKADGTIKIYKFHRGKKTECKMTGFDYYTKDLKEVSSKFAKKFGCGCNVVTDERLGECINVQGDIENGEVDLWEYLEQDKFMAKLKIDTDKLVFEDMGNKKGRKKN